MKEDNDSKVTFAKKIWIDLDNTPHVPFFKPIIEELGKRGYKVFITARGCLQVCELADHFNMRYKCVGRHPGKNIILKAIGTVYRAAQLAFTVLMEKPNLAVSHGSRAQLIAAKMLGIPCVQMLDYEYTQWFRFIHPALAIAPEVIPDNVLRKRKIPITKYPGIKEDIYVHDFKPDPSIVNQLGLSDEDLVIAIRPPATEAHYHNPKSEELFKAAVDFLCSIPEARLVILPRKKKQELVIKNRWRDRCSNGKIIIPKQVVDGLNLLWHSDLVVSGGGTMNREAAALGVPVYSIFRGRIGAVDEYLAKTGRLVLLESVKDVQTKILVKHRHRRSRPSHANSAVLKKIVDRIIAVTAARN